MFEGPSLDSTADLFRKDTDNSAEIAEPVHSLKELDWTPTQFTMSHWWKTLGWTSLLGFCGFLDGLCVVALIKLFLAQTNANAGVILFVAILFLSVVAYLVYLPFSENWITFWKTKVMGYNLVCVYNEVYRNMSYYLLRRGQTPHDHNLALILPVNGWFTKARIISKFDSRGWGFPAQRWKIHLDTLKPIDEKILISLSDNGGNRIRQTPEVVCHILEHFSLTEIGFFEERWSCVLTTLLDKQEELKLAQSKIGQLVTAMTADTEIFFEAIIRLERTKRLFHSSEGQKIRDWLVAELLKRLPPDDPRHKIYAPAEPESSAEKQAS